MLSRLVNWLRSTFVVECKNAGFWGLEFDGAGWFAGFNLALVVTDQLPLWCLVFSVGMLLKSPCRALILRIRQDHERARR